MEKILNYLKKASKVIWGFIVKFKICFIVTVLIQGLLIAAVLNEGLNEQQMKGMILSIPLYFSCILIGSLIGEAVRKFTKPENVYTSGVIDTLKTKLFWIFGPQLIGGIIGLLAAIGLNS